MSHGSRTRSPSSELSSSFVAISEADTVKQEHSVMSKHAGLLYTTNHVVKSRLLR
jgi:hypothetical protein